MSVLTIGSALVMSAYDRECARNECAYDRECARNECAYDRECARNECLR